MASSDDERKYEELKRVVNQQKREGIVQPRDLYQLAQLLARWKKEDTLPVCLLCQDVSKKITQKGHIFPHSLLKEAKMDNFLDFIRGAEARVSKMGYYAFCPDCEQKFQQGEVHLNPKFFKEFFHKPDERIKVKVQDDKGFPWLFYACISIVWRSMCFIPLNSEFIEVLECLRRYLLDWTYSGEMNEKVKLFLFAPNSEIEQKLLTEGSHRRFFYETFHARFQMEPLDGQGCSGWIFCGPLHMYVLYMPSKDRFEVYRSREDFNEWEVRSMLETNTKQFTIGRKDARIFPMSMYDLIVKWGMEVLSSIVRLPGQAGTSNSSVNLVEGTHLHLLPKDVSYNAASDEFSFNSKFFKQEKEFRNAHVTIVKVSRGKEKIIFVAVKGALKNGSGEVAIGLTMNSGGTVSYMKEVVIPHKVVEGEDLTDPPYRAHIEKLCRDLKFFD